MTGSLSGRADEELVALAIGAPDSEHGRRAASELFRRYSRRIYLWCFRIVRDHERALDLAQDAMLSAYRNLSRYQGRSRFSSWMFAIARNRCLSSLRPVSLLRDESAEPDELAASSEDPLERIARMQDEDAMLSLVNETLEPDEQAALWLRCYEGLPVDEITKVLGIESASGARGLLQTARRRLRAALEPGDDNEPAGEVQP